MFVTLYFLFTGIKYAHACAITNLILQLNMKTTPAQKVTIDDLAVMVKKGFDEMDMRFEDVDKQFVDIRQTMATLATKEEVGKQFAEIRQTMATKIDVDEQFAELRQTVATKDDVNHILVNHEKRLHKVEMKLQIA
jgi:hypothetical protein